MLRGWQRRRWKAAVRDILKTPERLGIDETIVRREHVWLEARDVVDMVGELSCIPDAWRIKVEDRKQRWGHGVLVIELLEVEVTNHVSDNKMRKYERLWWHLDATEIACLRIFRMDRFGSVSPLLTGATVYNVLNRFGRLDKVRAEARSRPKHTDTHRLGSRNLA